MKPANKSRASNRNNPIETLRKRLDAWRKTHKPRSRIPEDLWGAAVQMATQAGVNKTAKALHLDYYSLKKRIPEVDKEPEPSFIELRPAVSAPAPEYVIELEAQDGAKMRIQIKGTEMPELSFLSREFWTIKR